MEGNVKDVVADIIVDYSKGLLTEGDVLMDAEYLLKPQNDNEWAEIVTEMERQMKEVH